MSQKIKNIEDIDPIDDEGADEFYEHLQIIVDQNQSPLRIDKFLVDKLEKASRQKIQNGLKSGATKVNNAEVKPNYKVRPRDVIDVTQVKIMDADEIIPENIPLNIVYEDDYLMVIYKEPGMVVHPGFGNRNGTLVNALAYYLKSKDRPVMAGNDNTRPYLVHRIDKDTSGLLLVAKEDYTLTHLAKQFYDHTIDREYRALIWGVMDTPKGTIDVRLTRNPKNRMQFTGVTEGDEGKRAITHFETVEDFYYVSLVKCRLETGRTHQIRAHFTYLGHPLFNDERYGGNKVIKGTVFSKYKQFVENCFEIMPRQGLHAASLGFEHPITGERMFFESPMPEDMLKVLEKWRTYIQDKREKMNEDDR